MSVSDLSEDDEGEDEDVGRLSSDQARAGGRPRSRWRRSGQGDRRKERPQSKHGGGSGSDKGGNENDGNDRVDDTMTSDGRRRRMRGAGKHSDGDEGGGAGKHGNCDEGSIISTS